MNFNFRSFALPAAALALPMALLAQAPSSSTPTTPGATGVTRPTDSTSPGSTALPRDSSLRGDGADRALSSGNGMGIAAIQRVTQDRVDQQLTAKTLIGKPVFDNQGRRIGEVKDVILDATGAPALAGAFSHGSTKEADHAGMTRSASSSGSMSSSTPSATSTAPTSGSDYATSSPAPGHSAANPNGTVGATGSSLDQRSLSNGLAAAAGWENSPAAIISSGGFLGMGDNLLRVPLNQLSYDGSKDRITLNVSQTELSSLPNPSETTKSAAE